MKHPGQAHHLLTHFPGDSQLNICMGISYMNVERYDQALAHLQPYEHLAHVLPHLIDCCRILGLDEQAESYRKRFEDQVD